MFIYQLLYSKVTLKVDIFANTKFVRIKFHSRRNQKLFFRLWEFRSFAGIKLRRHFYKRNVFKENLVKLTCQKLMK